MGTFEPIRDAAGGIIGVTPRESDEPLFAAVLRDTLAAVDAAPADEPGEQPPHLSRRQLVGSAAVVLLALALFALSRQTAPATSVIVRPAAPVPTVARPTASMSTPTTAPPTIARMVVAYAAPGGDVLGPILLPTAAVARFGGDWVEVTWQGGRVWVRLSDAPGLEIARLPDLQPPTPAPVVIAPPAAPPLAADNVAPAEAAPTAHSSTHERPALDRTTPTSVPAFTVR